MRVPTSSERRLLMVFGLIIFLLANIIAGRWYFAAMGKLQADAATLKQTASEYRALLNERPRWEVRRQWLDAHPFPTHTGSESDSRFAEDVQSSLTRNHLTIEAQQIDDPIIDGRLLETRFEFTAKGNLENVIRWLCEIQQPGQHVALESITLRQTEDAMTAKIRLGKIFATEPAAP